MSRRMTREDKAAIERAGLLHRLATENFYAMPLEQLRRVVAAIDQPPLAADHDAAPAARADADRERPDNPPARPGDGTGDTPTFTDAEREAVEWAARETLLYDSEDHPEVVAHGSTLRALLARHGGGA